jgi:hypothetical protein
LSTQNLVKKILTLLFGQGKFVTRFSNEFMKSILIILFSAISLVINAQTTLIMDSDKIHLRDSLNGKVVFLSYIERGEQNKEAIWITYNRRPLVDPWIAEAKDKETRYSEDVFIKYWKVRNIRILGALTTDDDCGCYKTRTTGSPDMYLIHFKIFLEDWFKMQEIYPGMETYLTYLRKVKFH